MYSEDLVLDWMKEEELPQFVQLVNDAFSTAFQRLLGRVPSGRPVGERVRNRFYRPATRILVIRDEYGKLVAALPLQHCGTRCVPGPLAIATGWQEPWRKGVAAALVQGLLRESAKLGWRAVDSVTFPHSVPHFQLYWKFGAPIFQALLLARPVGSDPHRHQLGEAPARYSHLHSSEQREALSCAREITGRVSPGFDLSADIEHAHQRRLGETFLFRSGTALTAFAICHFGAGSEAYLDDQLLIKYLYVDPHASKAEVLLDQTLSYVELEAARVSMKSVAFMVSSAHRASVDVVLKRGYRILSLDAQWLMLPESDDCAVGEVAARTFRPNQFAFADWR